MNKTFTTIAGISLMMLAVPATAETILSPDGNLKMDFTLSNDGQPTYSLTYKGREVVKPSRLGFTIKNAKDMKDNFEIVSTDTVTVDENWRPVWGEEAEIRNHYKQLKVNLKQKDTNRKLGLCFRLFDDGLGFRYEFPFQKKLNHFTITDELTEFAMTGDHEAYWIPADHDTQEYD